LRAERSKESIMLRKFGLVAVAAASLAAAALAPTTASAFGGHGWHGGWHGGGLGWGGPRVFIGGPAYAYGYGYGGCHVRRLVPTPWGPRWRLVNRCY
jgi:opacity protein-like surface antigen